MRVVGPLLLALGLSACAQNAIFEVTFLVPAPEETGVADATVAVLDFRASPSTTPPRGLGNDVGTATLTLGGEPMQTVSVVASGDDLATPLWVGVTYCRATTGCLVPEGQHAWVRYERAFYLGRYTQHEVALPPSGEVIEVDRCRVYGCLEDLRPTEGACGLDGLHACER
ncbi:MAG: hypothetical protein R3B82_16645 [Sandaracinaceae bacterium]